MTVRWCPTCDGYLYGSHKCPPAWRVWRPEHGETVEDARKVYASTSEEAAEKWADLDDTESAEYGIVSGDEARVVVRPVDGGTEEGFTVVGEAVPSYTARPSGG